MDMRLDQLILKNYRCFEEISVDFHPQLTVLIAPNGAGKTTILDAARVALWPFVKGFDLGSQTGKSASIQISDVRLALQASGNMEPQTPCEIKATGHWSETQPGKVWVQFRERMKAGTNTIGDASSRKMTNYGESLEKAVRNGVDVVTLPLVTYLGTSRLWYEGRFTSIAKEAALGKNQYSRTSGYLNCLAYTSSFRAFTVWYGWVYRSYREAQLIALERNTELSEEGRRFAHIVQVIKSAVDALVKGQTGWHSLEYSASHQQQLVMRHEQYGVMPVEMLSDGLRNTIAMVADIAFRAYKLNPHLGVNAAQQTPGVALIDEVDMFLHPAWQQTILESLTAAFPKLQFIVTTHSPQVLSTVRRENIRIIGPDTSGKIIATPPLAMTYGEPSGDVLHSVMMVDPQPPVQEKADLRRLTMLVDQGEYESSQAVQLRQALRAALGEQHPQLQRLERSIERQKMLRKMVST
jgi:predicted ATP-binding protein involved in virulence